MPKVGERFKGDPNPRKLYRDKDERRTLYQDLYKIMRENIEAIDTHSRLLEKTLIVLDMTLRAVQAAELDSIYKIPERQGSEDDIPF